MGGKEWATLTDVGRIRTNNEDKCLVDRAAELYVVCDGMGGHNAGEVASKICCDTLHEEIGDAIARRHLFAENGDIQRLRGVAEAVREAVEAACRAIFTEARQNSEHQGMGTTCTMVLMAGRHKAVMAHVGDSRLYMLRGGEVVQISEDHTYVGELVKRGALTAEQALGHPQGNVLSRAMGVQEEVAVDHLIFDVDPEDTLLLCSDGVYSYFPDPRELGGLLADEDLDRAAEAIVGRALERGGHDNCTVVLWRPPADPALTGVPPPGQRAALLAGAAPFTHLSPAELVAVAGITQVQSAAAGTVIRRPGLREEAWMLVLEGAVDVFAPGAGPASLGPGGALGVPALVGAAEADLTARSAGPCHFLALAREDLAALVEAQPPLGAKVLFGLAEALGGAPRGPAVAAAGGPERF